MSVILPARAISRWKALWPLALLLAVSIIGGIWLWRAWPQVLMQSAVWQRSLNLNSAACCRRWRRTRRRQGCRCWGLALFTGCSMP